MTIVRSQSARTAAAVLTFTVLLCGCATTEPALDTAAECKAADWEKVGLADGSAGKNAGYIAVHRDNCKAFDVVPALEPYQKGYVQGVLTYCTKERGYLEGSKNRPYLNACPEEYELAFKEGYAAGLIQYQDQEEFRRSQMRDMTRTGQETVPQ